MRLSRMKPNQSSPQARRDLVSQQELHKTIERLFSASRGTDGKLTERVLYRRDGIVVLIQSITAPDWATHKRIYPDYHSEQPITKEINPQFVSDQVWLYKCRVNPSRLGKSPEGKPHYNGIYYAEAQIEWWLASTAKRGFKVLSATTNPDRWEFKGSRRRITMAVGTFCGFLQVTDASIFSKTFQKGIGKGKAFGLGLLSIFPGERK